MYNITPPNPIYPVSHTPIIPNINPTQLYSQNYNIPTINTTNSTNNHTQNSGTYTTPPSNIQNNTPKIITPRWEEVEYERKLKEEESKRKEEELKKKARRRRAT